MTFDLHDTMTMTNFVLLSTCWTILVDLQLVRAFGVFLSMWTQGQVHVLNSGHSIELDCEFYAEDFSMFNNPVMWKKYQRQEQSEVNIMGNILPPFLATGRFSVTLTKNPPRYTLRLKITELALEDSGNYTCEVRGPKSSIMATVTHYIFIRAPVQRLYFSDGSTASNLVRSLHSMTMTFIEHIPGHLRCTSVGGYPPPELQVYVGDRNVTGLFSLFTTATLHGTKGLRVMIYTMERWTERLILAAEDDGKRLRCVATVSGLASNSTFAQASVKYRPVIRCPPVSAFLGDRNVHLLCEVRARPGLTALFWTIDNNGTTVSEGEVIDEYWTLVMDRSDGLMETQLFMRKTTAQSFRKYMIFAENAIAVSSLDVWLIQKLELETTEMALGELIQQRKSSSVRHRGGAVPANPKYVHISSPSSFSSTSSSSSSSSPAVHLLLPAVVFVIFSCLVLTLAPVQLTHSHSFRSGQSSRVTSHSRCNQVNC